MPTPNEAALIRTLARRVRELRGFVSSVSSPAAFEAELMAQAKLIETARQLGVPLAEATETYGLSTALVPVGEGASTGLITRGSQALTRFVGTKVAVGTGVVIGLGILTWLLASLAGRMSADKPVKPGVAMSGTRPTPPADLPPEVGPTDRPIAGGEFFLVDTKQVVSVNRDKWEVNGKGGSATLVLNSGTHANYTWTVPTRIGPDGVDLQLSAQSTAGKGRRLNATLGVSGGGLQFSTGFDERCVSILAEAGESKSGSKSVHVTVPKTATEIKLVMHVGYDVSVEHIYKRAAGN